MVSTRRRRANSRNNRKNSRNNRTQRGGAATDGGYGMPQQYYNPSMFSTRTESDTTSISSAPTPDVVRPTMFATTPANYDAINGVGAVPKAMLVGGRRSLKRQRGGFAPPPGHFLSGAILAGSPVGTPMRGGRRSQKKKTHRRRK